MPLKPGDIVGTYEVIGPLGTGGMATVLHATHTVLGSDHALKILRSELVTNAEIRRRFLDEGRVQAQLRHPGIVRVTGIVSEPGVAGLVMDLLTGASLEEELQRGPIDQERAIGWMLQALDAVAFAHDHGIVHRDLKPANLFVVDGEDARTVKILDFGIAKVGGGQTRAGGTLGTYGFMAPEQLKDASDVDGRADVFALGAVFFEMLTGRPAFHGATDFELMKQVSAGVFEAGAVPEPLRSIVERALKVDRSERYARAVDFADALRPLARPQDRALIAAWDALEHFDPRPIEPSIRATMDVEVEPVAPLLHAPPSSSVVAVHPEPMAAPEPSELAERQEIMIRVAGAAQLFTGALNTFLLWMLSCYGYPKLFGLLFGALGLPGVFQPLSICGGVLGFGLLIVGPLELASGLRAQMRGAEARGIVLRTATLQVASLAFGGVPSFLVGLLTTVLLLLNPDRREDQGRGM